MSNLIKKFQNISHQHDLWQKDSKIVLGVSGGPDSVCLLDIFSKLQNKYALELIIAHVNYKLRGKDSFCDEKFVRDLANNYGLKFFILKPKIKLKSENALREIRYRFFEKIRKNNNFDLVAVAHNADDQVETFLMRLIRGSGLVGMSAMKFKSGKIIRPLLGIYRQEILDYLKNNQRAYRIDKSNQSAVFLRNKIRNLLIPELEKFNPNIKKTLFDATQSITFDNEFLNIQSAKLAKTDSASKLLEHHPALQRRVILDKIKNCRGHLKDIVTANVDEIIKVLKSTKSKKQIVLFRGLKLTKRGDKVIIRRL